MSAIKTFKAPLAYFRGLLQRYGFIKKRALSMTVLNVWGDLTRDVKLWGGIRRGRLPLEMRLAELTTAELTSLRQRVTSVRRGNAKQK
jgi:hypothetical protein